ncbi:MAG: hypothetical protein V2A77_05410 [Pseudomonadota bacterium]
MKKVFTLACAGLLTAGLAATAFAEVTVITTVTKTKTINEIITPTITKTVLLNAKQLAEVDSSAQADVTKNDTIAANVVIELPGELVPLPSEVVTSHAELSGDVFNAVTGIVSLNQAPGNANNQGNAVALAYANDNPAFLGAQAHVDKLVTGNAVIAAFSERSDAINDAFLGGVTGVFSVNQAAGNVNNQDNAVAVAIGADPVMTLAESDLGMTAAANIITETDVNKTDLINMGAFSGASGITSINQASGNANNQANSVAVTVTALSAIF